MKSPSSTLRIKEVAAWETMRPNSAYTKSRKDATGLTRGTFTIVAKEGNQIFQMPRDKPVASLGLFVQGGPTLGIPELRSEWAMQTTSLG